MPKHLSADKDGEYDPISQQCPKKTKSKALKVKNVPNSSKWNRQENSAYMNFINKEITCFEDPENRKKTKIFKRMSRWVKTRTPDQCRSHHQKMTLYHGDNKGIVTHLEDLLDNVLPSEDDQKEPEQVEQVVNSSQTLLQNDLYLRCDPRVPQKSEVEVSSFFEDKMEAPLNFQDSDSFLSVRSGQFWL